jgi:hypothetical protein
MKASLVPSSVLLFLGLSLLGASFLLLVASLHNLGGSSLALVLVFLLCPAVLQMKPSKVLLSHCPFLGAPVRQFLVLHAKPLCTIIR